MAHNPFVYAYVSASVSVVVARNKSLAPGLGYTANGHADSSNIQLLIKM